MANSLSPVERLVRKPAVHREILRKLVGIKPDLDLIAGPDPDGPSASSAQPSAVASIWQFMVGPVEQTALARLQQKASIACKKYT